MGKERERENGKGPLQERSRRQRKVFQKAYYYPLPSTSREVTELDNHNEENPTLSGPLY